VPETIAVVGGGVSGLAVTFHLRSALKGRGDVSVVCLEAAASPGGNIATASEDGYTCEWGPNGFLDNEPATLELVRDVGIEDRLLRSNQAAATSILSPWGRARVLGEPFTAAKKDDSDESVFDFAARRIGREAAAILVDAMVSGIYAGDARRLSLKACFPKMWTMESEHGGLFKAMLARRREKTAGAGSGGGPAGPGGTLMSFRGGMRELIDGLAAAVGPALRTGCRVSRIVSMGDGGYRLHVGEEAPIDAAVVVLACPAWFAVPAIEALDPAIAEAMKGIPSAPVAVVHLGFEPGDLESVPDGFGFLVPRGEGPRILGCLWSSSIFDGRAEGDRVLLTCMLGGATDPEAIELPDDELVRITRGDLETSMDVRAEPRFIRIFRHPRGIPQYTLGHLDRLAGIEDGLARHPGLLVSGNSYHGISVNACAAEAPGVAADALRQLDARSGAV
jgi:oxygen-dependent protoporphyrinogen oxidase